MSWNSTNFYLDDMLTSEPIGAGEYATACWHSTKGMTVGKFIAFWQQVSPHSSFPGTEAGDDVSYHEWEDKNGVKCYGSMKFEAAVFNFLKHGIVRTISKGPFGSITEATYFADKKHGLSFEWLGGYGGAFQASIYNHGEAKAFILWNPDWSESGSAGNKELILQNVGLSIFKP